MIKEAISKIVERKDLEPEEAKRVMEEIMGGEATSAQIATFLTALRMKGETVEEIVAFVHAMLRYASVITPNVDGVMTDTCGTGGDSIKTFNISTISAFVSAGAGLVVAKHGNRAVSSKAGSADVLEALGLDIMLEPDKVCACIENVGMGFMFAPVFHPAMKYALGPRREIGIRTVFNILGPLANPAKVQTQVVGVYDGSLVEKIANVLAGLGVRHAIVAHGVDGLDEISTLGKTAIAWLKEGEVANMETTPRDFGVKKAQIADIRGTTPDESADILFKILNGHIAVDDPKTEIVLVNSAAGIMVGGKAEDFSYGIAVARKSIESGAAYKKLKALIKTSGGNLAKLEELELKYG